MDFVVKLKDFWQGFNLEKWAKSVGGSSAEAVQAAVYFGLCFGIGFVFKRYFKFMFACLIVSAFMIKALEYNHLITIDWTAVKGLAGVGQSGDFNAILNHFFDWIKNHLLLFISSLVGFLVGYKLG